MTYTILLLTHNRPDFVRRFVRFYESFPGTSVVVAASGSEDSTLKVKNIFEESSLKNFKLNIFDESIDFREKIIHCLRDMDYEIIALCGDDDCILPDALAEAASFLEKHPDYVSVSGYMFTLGRPMTPEGQVSPETLSHPYLQIPIALSKPLARLSYHLNNYTPTFYNVYRRKDLLLLFENILPYSKQGIFNYNELELFQSALTVVQGKIHVLEKLYMVRQGYNSSSNALQIEPLEQRMKSKEFKLYCRAFIKKLASSYKDTRVSRLSIFLSLMQYLSRFTFLDPKTRLFKEIFRPKNSFLDRIVLIVKKFNSEKETFDYYFDEGVIKPYKNDPMYQKIADLISKHPLGISK